MSEVYGLVKRLTKGAEVLGQMEPDEVDTPKYRRYLTVWLDLLSRYEAETQPGRVVHEMPEMVTA